MNCQQQFNKINSTRANKAIIVRKLASLIGMKKQAQQKWTPKNYMQYSMPYSVDASFDGRVYPRYDVPMQNISYSVPGRQFTVSKETEQIPENRLLPGQKVSLPIWFPYPSIYLKRLLYQIPDKGPNGQITASRRLGYKQALKEYGKSLLHMKQNMNKSPQLSQQLVWKQFGKPIPNISKAKEGK